jgi:zinc and cadmium transporter
MTVLWIALAIAIDGAAGLAGALLPERWLVRYRPALLGFAAGALLAAALLDLMPDAIAARGTSVLPWLLASIAALAVFEWSLPTHDHHDHVGGATPYALLGSDALHNFGDGMAIAAAFVASPRLGLVTAAAVIVHEVPQEVADYAVLRAAKMGKRRALLALVGVQLTAALGAAATLLGGRFEGANGIVLALAAGTFIYIACVELLPDVLQRGKRSDRVRALVALLAGIAVVGAVS